MNLLSTSQAAARLGVSARRVRMLIEEGALRAQQLGREWVIEDRALAHVKVYGKPGRPPKPAGNETRTMGRAGSRNGTSTRGRKGGKK